VSRRRAAGLVSAGLILLSLAAAAPVTAKGHVNVLLDGLNSPKGIAVGPHSVFVGQGWAGPPAPVLEYLLTGRNRGTAGAISDPFGVVDIAGTPDGAGWAIAADGADRGLFRQATPTSTPEAVFDIIAYQAIDIDPDDINGDPAESNPNGLTGLWTNDVLIADAAGNDLLRVSPNGDAVTVARWPTEVIPNHIPGLPSELPTEAVPTTVTIGPDGWAYVGQLIGFPGTPGTAHIWRVNPLAEDAVCDVNQPNANCSVWKSGFTSIFDIAFNPHNGTLYVYEIAEEGWLAFEEGFAPGGEFPPAVLLKVKGGKTTELVRGQLSQPGGVGVGNDGAVYVTDGMFTGGRLSRITGT
jgi:hypothetical protein